MAINDPWEPPEAPAAKGDTVCAIDPRVDTTHSIGVLPCPSNPPPPDGWEYWRGPIPAGGGSFAEKLLHDSHTYPMGSFVQTRLGNQLVAARVEWHDLQGATGKRGCFRGVNLMKPVNHDAPEVIG